MFFSLFIWLMLKNIWSLLILNISFLKEYSFAQFANISTGSYASSSGCDEISCPEIIFQAGQGDPWWLPVILNAVQYYIYFWIVLIIMYWIVVFLNDKLFDKPRKINHKKVWKIFLFIYIICFLILFSIILYEFL